ncbi:DeoR/GlpR family DNA-binding transcription regulator [Pedobacter nutrimenti]|jgi:DeoR/GlpR family transcriptional regulator of sugar metabolism|uniref:DeoR family transcriptional regulator n=1 Tax=Pedobacter nutrimenti TaxID=1241337 RepID=A0A318UI25_9SPHI|nr:DeoR/GlpR family DNA-binding transcription regulator [Pedobacter nutrimenti]PYF75611.1 DeoR family transcriptional regulator [Pedobacter nutrimenti]|eukprot:gene4654-5439_t
MLKKERHDLIMRQINLHNRVLTSDLVQLLNVSEDTIRRDLQELADNNQLIKVHGGALSTSYQSSFNDQNVYARDAKICIAKKTIPLIKDGMVILTGGGTTIIELVKQLPENLQATFFTISPFVAIELAKYAKIEVILIGGLFSKNSQVTYGGHVITQLSEINADLCLLGTSAMHPVNGLTDTDWEINQLKKTMLNSCKFAAVLCISEKLNTTQRLKVAPLENIHYLVTELDGTSAELDPYRIKSLMIL